MKLIDKIKAINNDPNITDKDQAIEQATIEYEKTLQDNANEQAQKILKTKQEEERLEGKYLSNYGKAKEFFKKGLSEDEVDTLLATPQTSQTKQDPNAIPKEVLEQKQKEEEEERLEKELMKAQGWKV